VDYFIKKKTYQILKYYLKKKFIYYVKLRTYQLLCLFRNRLMERYESLREMLNVALSAMIKRYDRIDCESLSTSRVVDPLFVGSGAPCNSIGRLRTIDAADLNRE